MATTYSQSYDSRLTNLPEVPARFVVPNEQSILEAFPRRYFSELGAKKGPLNFDEKVPEKFTVSRVMDVVVEKESAPWLQHDNDDSMAQILNGPMQNGYEQAAYETFPQEGNEIGVNGDFGVVDDSGYIVGEGGFVEADAQMPPSRDVQLSPRPSDVSPPDLLRESSPTPQPGQRSQRLSKTVSPPPLAVTQTEGPFGFEQNVGLIPHSPKHPSVAGINGNASRAAYGSSPITAAAAAPSLKVSQNGPFPVSSANKAFSQQPVYITPPASPAPVNPVYSPGPPPPREEVCVECAMRDQDMADVDVTSSGVWDRDSDVYYLDLVRREKDEEVERRKNPDAPRPPRDPNRPRAKGTNRLTEPNLKLWTSMNPREPLARQQNIDIYVKTQAAYLEAEALARARALQESRALESRLRDSYDPQLRRSTYDLNNGIITVDESMSSRKNGRSSAKSFVSLGGDGYHSRHHSREVSLLDNGLMVEHVDVRKEEKEDRERRRREERRERSRARKSSRGSGIDVSSMYSAHSPLPHPDSGFYSTGAVDTALQRPMSRYSQSSSRPMSVLTSPVPLTPSSARPPNRRLHSQVSLADTQSISSASLNRRSRFFSFRNWSNAWRSQESFAPSGVSGSMLDMHVALENEKLYMPPAPAVDISRDMAVSPAPDIWSGRPSTERTATPDRPKKKKGFAKLFQIFTGNKGKKVDGMRRSQSEVRSLERSEDDLPLAPPPPLSYLVNRGTRDRSMSTVVGSIRQPSTPSLPLGHPGNRNTLTSPVPSVYSNLPTPVSPRTPWQDPDLSPETGRFTGSDLQYTPFPAIQDDPGLQPPNREDLQRVAPMASMPDMRQRVEGPVSIPMSPSASGGPSRPLSVLSIHKSLPPLPDELSRGSQTTLLEARPHTMYNLDGNGTQSGVTIDPQCVYRQDGFRQSTGLLTQGLGAPHLHTFPLMGKSSDSPGTPDFGQYNELGLSRSREMYDLPDPRDGAPSPLPKRRSKFGLANLLGRKSQVSDTRSSIADDWPSRQSDSEIRHDSIMNGMPPPRAFTTSRMSVASRKAIEELVDQDSEFVAIRYPSAQDHVYDLSTM